MKKIISVLLALICLFSVVSVVAYAADDLKEQLGQELGLEIGKDKVYGVVFQSGDAKTMYVPPTQTNLDGPGYLKLSKDEPIAIGKNFRCWKDKNGKDVFPGQEIYVDQIVYLTADWSVKSTKLTALDTIICALKTMIHMLQISIKLIDTAYEFRKIPVQTVVEEDE